MSRTMTICNGSSGSTKRALIASRWPMDKEITLLDVGSHNEVYR